MLLKSRFISIYQILKPAIELCHDIQFYSCVLNKKYMETE